jgi:hypothetical protein
MPVVANIRLDGMRKPIIRSHIDAAAGPKAWSAAASPETPEHDRIEQSQALRVAFHRAGILPRPFRQHRRSTSRI